MATKRKVEIFTANCPACQDTIDLVQDLACSSCEIEIHDMNDDAVATRADELGINSVPSIVVDGRLLDCCRGGPTAEELEKAGIGSPKG